MNACPPVPEAELRACCYRFTQELAARGVVLQLSRSRDVFCGCVFYSRYSAAMFRARSGTLHLQGSLRVAAVCAEYRLDPEVVAPSLEIALREPDCRSPHERYCDLYITELNGALDEAHGYTGLNHSAVHFCPDSAEHRQLAELVQRARRRAAEVTPAFVLAPNGRTWRTTTQRTMRGQMHHFKLVWDIKGIGELAMPRTLQRRLMSINSHSGGMLILVGSPLDGLDHVVAAAAQSWMAGNHGAALDLRDYPVVRFGRDAGTTDKLSTFSTDTAATSPDEAAHALAAFQNRCDVRGWGPRLAVFPALTDPRMARLALESASSTTRSNFVLASFYSKSVSAARTSLTAYMGHPPASAVGYLQIAGEAVSCRRNAYTFVYKQAA